MMIALLFLLAAGQTVSPPAGATSEKFSILVDPCASANDDKGRDIVVCGRPDNVDPRLPLRDFRGVPDHAVPSNPDMRASVALDGKGIGNECGGYGEGCPVGMGGYAIPALLQGAVDTAKRAFAKKPDKTGRVAIPLDDIPPPPSRIDP